MKAKRTCKHCGKEANTEEELSLFKKSSRCHHGRLPVCKICYIDNTGSKYYDKNNKRRRIDRPRKINKPGTWVSKREERLYKNYGILESDYDKMFIEQEITTNKLLGYIKDESATTSDDNFADKLMKTTMSAVKDWDEYAIDPNTLKRMIKMCQSRLDEIED